MIDKDQLTEDKDMEIPAESQAMMQLGAEAMSALLALAEQLTGKPHMAMLVISPAGDPSKCDLMSNPVSQEMADSWAEKIKQLPLDQQGAGYGHRTLN